MCMMMFAFIFRINLVMLQVPCSPSHISVPSFLPTSPLRFIWKPKVTKPRTFAACNLTNPYRQYASAKRKGIAGGEVQKCKSAKEQNRKRKKKCEKKHNDEAQSEEYFKSRQEKIVVVVI